MSIPDNNVNTDVGWRNFFDKLVYKAESTGKHLIKVNPRNTTRKCSVCGNIVRKDLKDRTYICLYCNAQLDRDFNAALNIRSAGMILWLEGVGHAGSPAGQTANTISSYADCKLSAVKQEARPFMAGLFTSRCYRFNRFDSRFVHSISGDAWYAFTGMAGTA